MKSKMKIAIVGCGYVADFYLRTLPNHPMLELVKVMDRDRERVNRFADYYSLHACYTLEEILDSPDIDIVVNLTNPRSHFTVSKDSLDAGKHVYSEKPLAMSLHEAQELVSLAKKKGLYISSAPCGILGETAQTVWKALRENKIGRVMLAYAELDNGMVFRKRYRQWISESGSPWPWKDEFEVGCTLEHAGYYLTWLTALFGPAKTVTAFSSTLVPDKKTDVPLGIHSPDFSVGCIAFSSGIVARLTCGISATKNHSLQIFGENGVLSVNDCWYYNCPVRIEPFSLVGGKLYKYPNIKKILGFGPKKYPLVRKPQDKHRYQDGHRQDFARGIAELAEAIAEDRPCRISSEFSLHNNELVLAIHNSFDRNTAYTLKTTFEPIAPMPWALG